MKKGYKLVWISEEGKSMSYCSSTALEYSMDEWTVPPYGALFLFDTLEHAEILPFTDDDVEIWEAEYEPYDGQHPDHIPYPGSEKEQRMFWERGYIPDSTMDIHEGTVFAKRARLIRRVK